MKLSRFCCLFLSCLAVILAAECHLSPRDLTVVTGKTVYGNLALEDVHIEISRQQKTGWDHYSDTRSGYHGSFRIHLPPGTYRITASKTLRVGQGKITITGVLDVLEVESSARRIDQVVVELTSGGDDEQ